MAVTSGLAVGFVTAFIVRLCLPSRARQKIDAVWLSLDAIWLALLLIVGAAVLLHAYPIGGLTLVSDGGALAAVLGDRTLFALPAVGAVLPYLDSLGLWGVLMCPALAALALAVLVAIAVKTRGKKQGTDAAAQTTAVQTESEPFAAESLPKGDPLGQPTTDGAQTVAVGATEEACEPTAEPPSAAETERGLSAQSLMGEIDALVTEAGQTLDGERLTATGPTHREVADRLRRAIDEGLALTQTAQAPASAAEEAQTDAPTDSDDGTDG